jgi:NIMA (never in mitosis gene a)-related kinase
MVTLKHAFDANSMKTLVLKILRGNYPAIPPIYSQDLRDLVAEMLIKDPAKRPSMRKILEKEFLSKRISKLLTNAITVTEFSSTFVKKHIMPHTKDNEESKDDDTNVSDEQVVIKS